MSRYIISDLHLDHANIIDYCDRPFEDVDHMNATIVQNWNRVVSPSDTVFYLGDFAWWDDENVREWAETLNGSMLVVRGNHDEFDAEDVPFPVVETCTLTHEGVRFYCSHYPEDVPEDSGWWHLYGHVHNNDLYEHPFLDPQNNRINVSAEVIDYTPLSLDRLVELLKAGDRLERLPRE